MKPENHAIRELKERLETASPDVAKAIQRVILSLNACLLNEKDKAAHDMCKRMLADEIVQLDIAMKRSVSS